MLDPQALAVIREYRDAGHYGRSYCEAAVSGLLAHSAALETERDALRAEMVGAKAALDWVAEVCLSERETKQSIRAHVCEVMGWPDWHSGGALAGEAG